MRKALICLTAVTMAAACSKAPSESRKTEAAPPAAASPATTPAAPAGPAAAIAGPPVAGLYAVNGKPAALSQVTAHADEPFGGKPVTKLVFTVKDQGGDPKADFNAIFGKFGDAIVVSVQPDGTVIGAEVLHSGLKRQGMVSMSGVLSVKDYRSEGGQISGHLTSGGPADVFGDKLEVDLAFHTAAP